jgi:uncharacterized membrane protein
VSKKHKKNQVDLSRPVRTISPPDRDFGFPADHSSARRAALIAQIQSESFSGPLPPPDALARYDQIVPGAAERIIAMAEKQAEHRQKLESTVVKGNTSSQTRGTWFAFIISMTAICGGIWLIHGGKSATGLATIITDLAALAAVFVYTRKRQNKERERKAQAIQEKRKP